MAEDSSLADLLKEEELALRRRMIHFTRPKRPLTLDEAIDLARRMADG